MSSEIPLTSQISSVPSLCTMSSLWPATPRITDIYDLTGTLGFGFYWWGADNPPSALVQIILMTPTGFWFSDFYDGRARWRDVFIPWGKFTWVSAPQRLLEPHRHGFEEPNKSQIRDFIWTVHTAGLRRLDYVYAPRARPAVKGKFIIRRSTSVALSAGFDVRRSASQEFPAEFSVRQPSQDLFGMFNVAQDSEDLKCSFEVSVLLEFFGPWVAVASNPRAIEYPFQEKLYHYLDRHWLFYVEDDTFRYIHSLDGENWSAPSDIISAGSSSIARMVSIWVDSGIVHYAICVSDGFAGNDLWYMRGTLAGDGSIAWDPRRTVYDISSSIKCKWPTICCTVNGYPFIVWYAQREASGQGGWQKARIIKSNTKDGTWTTNPNYPITLSSNDQIRYTTKPIPLDNGYIFVFYGGDARQTPWYPGIVYPFENEFLGRLADNTGLGAEASEAIGSTWDYHNSGSVINVGNDVIAAIVCADHALRICKWKTATGDWGTPAVIQTGLPAETLVKLLRFPSGIVEPEMFAILWLDLAADEIRYKISVDEGDTWSPGGNTSYTVLKQYGGGFKALDQWTSAYQASHIWGAIGFTFVNDSDELMYGYIRKGNAIGVP